MKNLLYSSLLAFSAALIVSCSYSNQANSDAPSQDTAAVVADTVPVATGDTIQAVAAKGDSVAAQSARTESTEKGTVSGHPGAVKNPGANQAETDSIKKSKTKGKKRN